MLLWCDEDAFDRNAHNAWSSLLALVAGRRKDGRYWGHSHSTTHAMSEEQLKAFMEAVKADAGLQEKLNAAADSDAVALIAKAAGFVISAEELQRAQAGTEVSEDELEGVAGGKYTNCWQGIATCQ